LYVQLHIYAKNSIAKSVHPNTVVKIKNKNFCKLARHAWTLLIWNVVPCSILNYLSAN